MNYFDGKHRENADILLCGRPDGSVCLVSQTCLREYYRSLSESLLITQKGLYNLTPNMVQSKAAFKQCTMFSSSVTLRYTVRIIYSAIVIYHVKFDMFQGKTQTMVNDACILFGLY